MKDFTKWHNEKQHIDDLQRPPQFVSEGDIWWIAIGENIGTEMSGKSARFSRPAIIYKKLARGFYLVIPTTTKQKEGSWYVKIRQKQINTYACLHQLRTIDYRRLYSKLGTLDDSDHAKVRRGFTELYK